MHTDTDSDWFKVGGIGLESWDQLLKPDDSRPLPNFVERDIYDRAVELVDGLSRDMPVSGQCSIIDLVKEFGTMASSGTIPIL